MADSDSSDNEEYVMTDDSGVADDDSRDAVVEESMSCEDSRTSDQDGSASHCSAEGHTSAKVVSEQNPESVNSSINGSSRIPAKQKCPKQRASKRISRGSSTKPSDSDVDLHSSCEDLANERSDNTETSVSGKDIESTPNAHLKGKDSENFAHESNEEPDDSAAEVVPRKNRNLESELIRSADNSAKSQPKSRTRKVLQRKSKDSISKPTDSGVEEPSLKNSLSVSVNTPEKKDSPNAHAKESVSKLTNSVPRRTSRRRGNPEIDPVVSSRAAAKTKTTAQKTENKKSRRILCASVDSEDEEHTEGNSLSVSADTPNTQDGSKRKGSQNVHAEESVSDSVSSRTSRRRGNSEVDSVVRTAAKTKTPAQKTANKKSRRILCEASDSENEEHTVENSLSGSANTPNAQVEESMSKLTTSIPELVPSRTSRRRGNSGVDSVVSSRTAANTKTTGQKPAAKKPRRSSEPSNPKDEEPVLSKDSTSVRSDDGDNNTQEGSPCTSAKSKAKRKVSQRKTKNSKSTTADPKNQENFETEDTYQNLADEPAEDEDVENNLESAPTEDGSEDPSEASGKASKTKPGNQRTAKRKPKNKKSPNPNPKKKLKKQQNLDFLTELLEYEDIPLNAKLILQKNDALEVLSAAEIDTLFESLSETVKSAAELIFEDLNHEVALKWLKSVTLLTIFIVESLPADEPIKESIAHVASLLGLLQKLDINLDLKEIITEVCTLLLAKNCEFSDQIFFLIINSLIDFILTSSPKSPRFKKCVKLLHSLERVITRLQITSKACEPLVGKFVNIVQCKEVVTVKEGKAFVSRLLTLDITLLPRFHQAIRETLALPQTKKIHANGYGEAYYLAWLHTAENKEMRQAIENKCFQNYMSAIFTMQRTGLEMSHLGHNVFTILSFLHGKREHVRLSKTITNLYTPLLWRYLRFENNLIRCNAAEVFFHVYPLEHYGVTKPDKVMHADRQHNEMADLLTDRCHYVRVIGIKGVFACLKSDWTTFSGESIQKLMKILVKECLNDASSSDVRCAVHRGFATLLDNEESHEYLARILPRLQVYVTDECDKVRVSFIKLLQKVKSLNVEELKYNNICELNCLLRRLAEEKNESVAKAVAELIFSDIFSKNWDEQKVLRRLQNLIKLNPAASRKLIQHSAKLFSYDEAYRLMTLILSTLRTHALEKVEKAHSRETLAEEDDVPEEIKPKVKRRRKHYGPLSERTNNMDDESCQDTSKSSSGDSTDSNISVSASKAAENLEKAKKEEQDQVISHALYDIVALLWYIHVSTLNSPEKKEDLNNLYELLCNQLSTVLQHYKGTPTFYSLLHLVSYIPLSKVMSVYCHIASACISQLKNCGHKMPYEECRCIVNALCAWNQGNSIIELLYDWLNEAFKVEDFNFSAFPANNARARKKKIRFEGIDVKPTCGLNLLDMIFSNPIDKKRILTKNYEQLMELFNFLERIKALIEKRIKNEEEFSADFLSDEFLTRCLHTYLKLAIVLHKDTDANTSTATMTEAFSASEFYLKLLQWCESGLVEKLDGSPDRVICSFVNVVIQAGSTMLAVNQGDKHIMAAILKLLSRCLSCGENGMLVLESAVKFLGLSVNHSLNHYSAKNLRHVYVATVPHFLECILDAAFYRNYDQETIMECVNDIVGMKKTLREVLLNYVEVHAKDKTNSILPRVINIIAKAIIQSFTGEVRKHNVAIKIVKLNSLPFFTNFLLSLINSRPVFCSLFLTCLNRNVSELYLNDGAQLLATISLLFTVSVNKFKFKPAEFNVSVKLANDILMKYRSSPDDSQLNESTASSGIIDREHNLDEQDVQSQGAQLLQQITEKIEERNAND